ncbi:MAG: VWA domain-containing protein [Patescibacteria group bacterium]
MKKILLWLGIAFFVILSIPAFSAFESSVINVFAHIENSLAVSTGHLNFGNVFPQQYQERIFSVNLSETFLNTDTVIGVDYTIKQKPKPRPASYDEGGRFINFFEAHQYCLDNQGDNPAGANYDPDYYDFCYRTLCPFLSKLPRDIPSESDTGVSSYFQGDHCSVPDPEQAFGSLSKPDQDITDIWTIDLKVPPIDGYVGQDWPNGCPIIELEDDMDFGCDLWIEITNIDEQLTFCGDNITQSPNDEGTGGPLNDGFEDCDGTDGVGPNQSCTDQCVLEDLTYCGDGIKQTPNDNNEFEQCDGTDGVGPHQTCTNQCTLENLTYCGDGAKQEPNDEGTGGPLNDGFEDCDGTDGVGPNQICTDQCILEGQTYCGDGIKQTPNDNNKFEQCDGTDGVGPHQTCTNECNLENLTYCGDGIKQTPNDEGTGGPLNNGVEACDGTDGVGEHQTCTNQCVLTDLTYCGDGIMQTPNDEGTGGPQNDGVEECDGTDGVGGGQICTDQCVLEDISCFAEADVMLVLDRSGSIDAGELATLKNAALDFVASLDPSPDGAHMGQASFSTRGTLDLHLTSVKASIDAAINALVAGGLTNLKEGIFWGAYEMRDSHIEHERPAVPDYMIIITDGNPNQPTNVATARALAIIEANNAKAAGITIYVVGVGTDPDTTLYLKNNIATSAAHYFDAGDFDDLSQILADISSSCE